MSNTAVGDIVTITISGDTPIGVVLAPGIFFLSFSFFYSYFVLFCSYFVLDPDGYAAVIKSWSRLPNGKFGPIQKVTFFHFFSFFLSLYLFLCYFLRMVVFILVMFYLL